MRRHVALVSLALSLAAAGCANPSLPSPATVQPAGFGEAAFAAAKKAAHHVYWTLYAGRTYPEVEIAKTPMTKESKVVNIGGGTANDLNYTSGMTFDTSGRLWILSFGHYAGNPNTATVFKLPLKAASTPVYEFVLSGTDGSNAITFDPSGNLWVSSPGNDDVIEYSGPFTKSGTLSPALTLHGGSLQGYGIAFDAKSNLYISIFNSSGTDSIAVAAKPYTSNPYFLDGLTQPGSLTFDKAGNLYASTNGSSPALVRYDKNDLRSGDTPSIVDPTGLPSGSYLSAFAFTATGDLYVANCGNSNSAGIDVYSTSRQQFGAKLAPSLLYSNADIEEVGCAWGIAAH
jgi:sugar lactone lactonase YvrE